MEFDFEVADGINENALVTQISYNDSKSVFDLNNDLFFDYFATNSCGNLNSNSAESSDEIYDIDIDGEGRAVIGILKLKAGQKNFNYPIVTMIESDLDFLPPGQLGASRAVLSIFMNSFGNGNENQTSLQLIKLIGNKLNAIFNRPEFMTLDDNRNFYSQIPFFMGKPMYVNLLKKCGGRKNFKSLSIEYDDNLEIVPEDLEIAMQYFDDGIYGQEDYDYYYNYETGYGGWRKSSSISSLPRPKRSNRKLSSRGMETKPFQPELAKIDNEKCYRYRNFLAYSDEVNRERVKAFFKNDKNNNLDSSNNNTNEASGNMKLVIIGIALSITFGIIVGLILFMKKRKDNELKLKEQTIESAQNEEYNQFLNATNRQQNSAVVQNVRTTSSVKNMTEQQRNKAAQGIKGEFEESHNDSHSADFSESGGNKRIKEEDGHKSVKKMSKKSIRRARDRHDEEFKDSD